MKIYKKMYYRLFNVITDALDKNNIDEIKEILKQGQLQTEEMYIESDENEPK